MPTSTVKAFKRFKSFVTTGIAACLWACAAAPALAKDETTPLLVDSSFNTAAAAAKGFSIAADNKALKGIKRVAVPVFAVE